MAAFQTMSAIKRKMHKLKTDKETEYDRVDQLEQKLIELRTLNEKVKERLQLLHINFTLILFRGGLRLQFYSVANVSFMNHCQGGVKMQLKPAAYNSTTPTSTKPFSAKIVLF